MRCLRCLYLADDEKGQVVFRSTLTGPAFIVRFTIVSVEPFAYTPHICLELKLSRGNPDIPSVASSALFDEDNQDPLKELDGFPSRAPEEEIEAVEWEKLDSMFAEMHGMQKVDLAIDVSAKLSKEETAGKIDALRDRMTNMLSADKLAVVITNVRSPKAATAAHSNVLEA